MDGTTMKKRQPKQSSSAAVPMIEPPTELSPGAREVWDKLAGPLAAAGRMTELDKPALVILCTAYADWMSANKALQEFGVVLKSPTGYPVQSPYVSIAGKLADTVIRLCSEFGMTPDSRKRLGSTPRPSWIDEYKSLDDFGLQPLVIDSPKEA
jgi:P27 family predicted phage terminase small subunit